ncbi:hypothetical protein chiPu_0029410, partial [Chiloscyllium punctatum]|nr:hypothetical protein [Chiloscyllium punctatum]
MALLGGLAVNGVLTNVPLRLGGDRLQIQQLGRDAVIQTDFGLRLSYDLSYAARVIVPGRYRAQLCGLCGNFNGDTEDEFLTPQKVLAPGGVTGLAASWSSPRPGEACNHGSQDTRPQCPQSRRTVLETDNYCGFLTAPSGPLAVCHSTVTPRHYFWDCVTDTCWAEGDTQVMCASLRAYMGLCQSMAEIDLTGQVHHKLC